MVWKLVAPELSGRELDAAVAERVMGLVWDEARCRACGWPIAATTEGGCTAESWSQRPYPAPRADEPAPYSSSIEAAMQVEDRIAELGKQGDYIAALWRVMGADLSVNFWTASSIKAFWLCVHASPKTEMSCSVSCY